MKFNLSRVKLFSSLTLMLIVVLVDAQYQFENKYEPPRPSRRRVLEALADNIVKYFDLENKLIADNYFQRAKTSQKDLQQLDDSRKCDNTDEINNYFLDSYSGKSRNMSVEHLESLIGYHVNSRIRDNFTEYRSKRNRCRRKRVNFI